MLREKEEKLDGMLKEVMETFHNQCKILYKNKVEEQFTEEAALRALSKD
jgi:DNA anti-recombination protein RmuC